MKRTSAQSKGSFAKKFYVSYLEKAKAFSLLFVTLQSVIMQD